ncbi:Putative uncharacterized protein [Taphrina deformans PYCC 5710]|uniref:Serine aminopeptidase S33 domain-containing protein n=1 Tax=Taphrina deformans (strain PYCC 5710 / ATCC 11124 / CBS 356.35 / IMI 108563 / JCM 9778 / NBRC 8474) TaxID=1097556 RepID=R4XCJ0_TAPDE|nr:Putative uncharacterized protein [Taphrina deformans PYCC 5710]|eukprot:CCG82071.1 Putative uncharacterized protein [Taphrina deformans PYCC 5710]
MQRRDAILFFIPGNPGITSYYTTFLTRLRASCPGLDIIASNHIGFDAGDIRKASDFIDLNAQIAHKVQLLDEISSNLTPDERHRKVPVFVAGHSVGGYMAIKVLEARPDIVDRVYFLFPTVNNIAASPQGVMATAALKIPGLITLATLFAWLLCTVVPRSFKYAAVRWFTGFPEDAVRVTADEVLTATGVHTALTLARSEMAEIGAPDAAFWEKYATRCSAYWATTDRWVSDTHRTVLLGIAKGLENYTCKAAPHAFCIRHGDLVADQVAKWLDRDVNGKIEAVEKKGTN